MLTLVARLICMFCYHSFLFYLLFIGMSTVLTGFASAFVPFILFAHCISYISLANICHNILMF
jgi:hypothetical protein